MYRRADSIVLRGLMQSQLESELRVDQALTAMD